MPEINEERDSILSTQSKRKLLKISRWGKFISLSTFIIVILLFVVIVWGIYTRTLPIFKDTLLSGFERNLSLTAYLLLLIFSIFPSSKLYLFSDQCSKALQTNDNALMLKSLNNLLSFFRFLGMILLIFLVLYILFLLIGMLSSVFNWGKY